MADLPPEIVELLTERAQRRAERDWAAADALRDRLHELGWEPIDSPRGSTARPRLRVADDGDLAPRLAEPGSLAVSVVAVVQDHPEDLERLADGLRRHPPSLDWELVVVANGSPPPDLSGLPARVLTPHSPLGWAEAANLGLRAAAGAVIVLVDTSLEPTGDWLPPLMAAFEDPKVGLAGPWGVTSADGRQFEEAPPGEVDAVEAYALALRREALREVEGFDHHFRFYRNADLDLSFAVRDAGWRAVRTDPLPLERHEHRGYTSLPDDERDRLSRRNFYRFLKHWGDRRDLLTRPGAASAPARR